MNLSSTSNRDMSRADSQTPPSNARNESKGQLNDTSLGGSSIYENALDNLTAYTSFDGSANDNSHFNVSTDATLNGSDSLRYNTTTGSCRSTATRDLNKNISANMLLMQSESTETNASQEEVDPKSQLANKTIFKTDNPDLSIIEISDNSIKEQEAENSFFLIESNDDSDQQKNVSKTVGGAKQKISPLKTSDNTATASSENRRKKAETLIQSSKQTLNVDVAEAFAAESKAASGDTNDIDDVVPEETHPATKRDLKIYDTIEDFEKNLPSTVTVLDTPFGSRVYLVGTAHFSEESQDDVSYVIRNVRPDVVMVELCPSRVHILKLDEKTLLEEAKNFNFAKIRSIIQTHGYINGVFFILLLQMSAQIAKDLGMAPGGEFRRAFEEIHRIPGCMLHLGDRPIRITLHRALRALTLWQTMKLVWRLTSTDTISIEEVEECKQRDLLEKLMQEMAGEFPEFSEVFVKERDIFLCHSLQLAALPQMPTDGSVIPRPVRVVGVVGIGHANGIAEKWGKVDPSCIPEIMKIPPGRLSTRLAWYSFQASVCSLVLYQGYRILKPCLKRLF
ncbi:PREDICTED: traB domain-containing protein [Bactrocera latifrons]|uniref:TraB domain-containing protein n=2 Tax=Bactrocera latifrons TaxID=174628 RepID=A0A0K8WMN1_BACLA|nr:PREDICTED: traB domain-containing protein [Bactrocera latifrons]